MGEKDWQLCQINGKWTGITHLPSWTIFEVKGGSARIFRRWNGPVKPTPQELVDLTEDARQLFVSGKVSRWPPECVVEMKVPRRVERRCRHSWGMQL